MDGYGFSLKDLVGATNRMFLKNIKIFGFSMKKDSRFTLSIEISSNSILKNAPLDFPKRTTFSNKNQKFSVTDKNFFFI